MRLPLMNLFLREHLKVSERVPCCETCVFRDDCSPDDRCAIFVKVEALGGEEMVPLWPDRLDEKAA